MTLETIASLTGIAAVAGTAIRYGFIITKSVVEAFSNLNTIMVNHLPHLQHELELVNKNLNQLREELYEIRKDTFSHPRGSARNPRWVEFDSSLNRLVDGGDTGGLETNE